MNAIHTDDRTPEQKRWQARHDAEQTAAFRLSCTLFRFWRVCTRKGCSRAKACNGDPHACFAQWWPHVPEEAKIALRAKIEALHAGRTPREAAAAATAEIARWRALQVPGDSKSEGVQAPAPSAPVQAMPGSAERADERVVPRARLV